MDARFDIYLSGKLADGVTPAAAAAAMAQLFKSTPEAMAAMIDGKPRLLKRDVDQATAHKYRDALQRAGVLVAFRPFIRAATPPPATPVAEPAVTTAVAAQPSAGLTLAPTGGDLLQPDERPIVAAVEVDIRHLQVEAPGELPHLATPAPPPAPDTSHLTVAAAGDNLAPSRPAVDPVTLSAEMAAMTLAPAGAQLETLSLDLPTLEPDISALSLAEPGELLTPAERHHDTPPAPRTDHIKLA